MRDRGEDRLECAVPTPTGLHERLLASVAKVVKQAQEPWLKWEDYNDLLTEIADQRTELRREFTEQQVSGQAVDWDRKMTGLEYNMLHSELDAEERALKQRWGRQQASRKKRKQRDEEEGRQYASLGTLTYQEIDGGTAQRMMTQKGEMVKVTGDIVNGQDRRKFYVATEAKKRLG